MKLRREVVEYIRQHREDFEPFVDEDVTFDRHVELLEQDGTYAGENVNIGKTGLLLSWPLRTF